MMKMDEDLKIAGKHAASPPTRSGDSSPESFTAGPFDDYHKKVMNASKRDDDGDRLPTRYEVNHYCCLILIRVLCITKK